MSYSIEPGSQVRAVAAAEQVLMQLQKTIVDDIEGGVRFSSNRLQISQKWFPLPAIEFQNQV
jgi:hypothetical protein